MKILIIFSTLLFSIYCKAENIYDDLLAIQDLNTSYIYKAQSNLLSLRGTASSISFQETGFLEYLNYDGLIDCYEILSKILSFEVKEGDVENARLQTDTSVFNITTLIVEWMQNPRDLMSICDISHFDLDNLVLDTITEHMNQIDNKGNKIVEEATELDKLIKNLRQDFKTNIDLLIIELNEEQQAEIIKDLGKMKVILDANLSTFSFFRRQLEDRIITTLDSLQDIIDQLPL